MTEVPTQSSQWRVHECLIDLSRETSFADDCVDRDRRPLVLVWGDSTAGALMPGLRKAQESRDFGIAQFTSSSCIPALNADMAGTPNCRAINDKVLSLARELKPDIVLLHGTWDRYLDGVAETVAALKQQTDARVVVLGSVPWWKRGLPNEVLRYFMLHHRLIPQRSGRAEADGSAAKLRDKLVPAGAEFISAWDAMCNADGCLTRIGDTAADISASDQVHLTEKGSVFLIQSIIDRMLGGSAGRPRTRRSKSMIRKSGYRFSDKIMLQQSDHAAARDPPGIDVENLAGCADLGECGRIGAGHPDLRAERRQFIEQRLAPVGIEMRDHLVEQQQRRDAGHLRHQRGVRQHQPDQQRLLLAGRGVAGRHVFRRVDHLQVGEMRAVEGAAGERRRAGGRRAGSAR